VYKTDEAVEQKIIRVKKDIRDLGDIKDAHVKELKRMNEELETKLVVEKLTERFNGFS